MYISYYVKYHLADVLFSIKFWKAEDISMIFESSLQQIFLQK